MRTFQLSFPVKPRTNLEEQVWWELKGQQHFLWMIKCKKRYDYLKGTSKSPEGAEELRIGQWSLLWRTCWFSSCFLESVVSAGPSPDQARCPYCASGWQTGLSPWGPRLGSHTISELFPKSTADLHPQPSRERKSPQRKWAGTEWCWSTSAGWCCRSTAVLRISPLQWHLASRDKSLFDDVCLGNSAWIMPMPVRIRMENCPPTWDNSTYNLVGEVGSNINTRHAD